jgi:hypothetical protein
MSRQIFLAIFSIVFVLSIGSCCAKKEVVKSPPATAHPMELRPEPSAEIPLPVPLPVPLPERAEPVPLSPAPTPAAAPLANSDYPATEQGLRETDDVSDQGSYRDAKPVRRPQQKAGPDNAHNTVDYSRIIEEQFKSLKQGPILFNPSKEMKAGVKEIVEVRIAKEFNDHIAEGLRGRGVPQVERIKVGTFMKVHLEGDNFEIKLRSNKEEQFIADSGFTPWEWDVTPNKGGPQVLLLTATVRLKLPDGREETQDYPVFRRPINVAVDPIYTLKEFIVKHWQWVISTLIIPAIGWIAKKKWDSKPADVNTDQADNQ